MLGRHHPAHRRTGRPCGREHARQHAGGECHTAPRSHHPQAG
jgi:hypothetical protein